MLLNIDVLAKTFQNNGSFLPNVDKKDTSIGVFY